MTTPFEDLGKKPAPLRNVAAFSTLMERLTQRSFDLPGLGCFSGPSGYGKSKSAVYAANRHQSLYVECDQFTTAKSLMTMILQELGVERPRGAVTDMISEGIRLLAADPYRPLIIDEAHHIAHKKFIDIARSLHDKSLAPIILIGEETLPKQLERFERVHNRVLEWCQAVSCNEGDFQHLCAFTCPNIKLDDDLASAILEITRGNTRRIVVNLDKARNIAARLGKSTLSLEEFGGRTGISDGRAPMPRAVR